MNTVYAIQIYSTKTARNSLSDVLSVTVPVELAFRIHSLLIYIAKSCKLSCKSDTQKGKTDKWFEIYFNRRVNNYIAMLWASLIGTGLFYSGMPLKVCLLSVFSFVFFLAAPYPMFVRF
jgi:hypothetical protein